MKNYAKAVLDAVIGIAEPGASVPMPEKNRWPYADIYMGDGWSVAYRVFDAQYWGVPQRRRRCYLVGDLRGQCAGRVLFESEGLSGYSAAGYFWEEDGGAGVVRLYDILDRVSCWCCCNKNLKELRNIRKYLPLYWEKLKDLQRQLERPMKGFYKGQPRGVFELGERFAKEENDGNATHQHNSQYGLPGGHETPAK